MRGDGISTFPHSHIPDFDGIVLGSCAEGVAVWIEIETEDGFDVGLEGED